MKKTNLIGIQTKSTRFKYEIFSTSINNCLWLCHCFVLKLFHVDKTINRVHQMTMAQKSNWIIFLSIFNVWHLLTSCVTIFDYKVQQKLLFFHWFFVICLQFFNLTVAPLIRFKQLYNGFVSSFSIVFSFEYSKSHKVKV